MGAYHFTPHTVALRWLEDVLDILKGHNIGFALWNFRGDFGILDSGRQDVAYADFRGHQLDQAMLDLLRRY
jgi:endoglucanase